MERITVFLTAQQKRRLERLAESLGLKFAELLRRLLDEALDAREARNHARE